MTNATDFAAIAAKLTPAQRRAVLAGKIGNGFDQGRGYWPLRHALLDKGLFTVANHRLALSLLGRELQAYILGAQV